MEQFLEGELALLFTYNVLDKEDIYIWLSIQCLRRCILFQLLLGLSYPMNIVEYANTPIDAYET